MRMPNVRGQIRFLPHPRRHAWPFAQRSRELGTWLKRNALARGGFGSAGKGKESSEVSGAITRGDSQKSQVVRGQNKFASTTSVSSSLFSREMKAKKCYTSYVGTRRSSESINEGIRWMSTRLGGNRSDGMGEPRLWGQNYTCRLFLVQDASFDERGRRECMMVYRLN